MPVYEFVHVCALPAKAKRGHQLYATGAGFTGGCDMGHPLGTKQHLLLTLKQS